MHTEKDISSEMSFNKFGAYSTKKRKFYDTNEVGGSLHNLQNIFENQFSERVRNVENRLEQKIENEKGLKKSDILTLLGTHEIKKIIKDAVASEMDGLKNAILKLEDRVKSFKKKSNFSERNNLKYLIRIEKALDELGSNVQIDSSDEKLDEKDIDWEDFLREDEEESLFQ